MKNDYKCYFNIFIIIIYNFIIFKKIRQKKSSPKSKIKIRYEKIIKIRNEQKYIFSIEFSI